MGGKGSGGRRIGAGRKAVPKVFDPIQVSAELMTLFEQSIELARTALASQMDTLAKLEAVGIRLGLLAQECSEANADGGSNV